MRRKLGRKTRFVMPPYRIIPGSSPGVSLHLRDYISARIEKDSNECWNWKLALTVDGYGKAKYRGKNLRAHRVSYEAFVGTIRGQLDHLCKNKKCVNPLHLEDVDQLTNIRRANGWTTGEDGNWYCKNNHAVIGYNALRFNGKTVCRECYNTRKRK